MEVINRGNSDTAETSGRVVAIEALTERFAPPVDPVKDIPGSLLMVRSENGVEVDFVWYPDVLSQTEKDALLNQTITHQRLHWPLREGIGHLITSTYRLTVQSGTHKDWHISTIFTH